MNFCCSLNLLPLGFRWRYWDAQARTPPKHGERLVRRVHDDSRMATLQHSPNPWKFETSKARMDSALRSRQLLAESSRFARGSRICVWRLTITTAWIRTSLFFFFILSAVERLNLKLSRSVPVSRDMQDWLEHASDRGVASAFALFPTYHRWLEPD